MADIEQVREWNAALVVGELDPLETETNSYYVKLVPDGKGQVDEIAAAIRLSIATQSAHLVSGPRGSGKSTELLRLRRRLEAQGHTVVYFDVLDYVSETQVLDIEIFLVVIGLAVSEALEEDAGTAGFSSRFRSWLKEWRPTEVSGEVGVDAGPVNAKVGAKFERVEQIGPELRSNPAFVDWLRDQVSYFLRELKDRVDDYISEMVQAHGNGSSLVMIVDSLEKVGSTARYSSAADATTLLFVDHPERLRFPRVHAVYTVPPIGPVLYPGFATNMGDGVLHQIAVPRVSNDGHGGLPVEKFVEAIDRRVGDASLIASPEDVERIVHASGGHLDDLLNLMRRVLTVGVARDADFPVGSAIVDDAIADLRATFNPGTEEQADVIRWVAAHGEQLRPPAEMVETLAHLLATHMVLHRRNASDWYEAHPLSLEAVGPLSST